MLERDRPRVGLAQLLEAGDELRIPVVGVLKLREHPFDLSRHSRLLRRPRQTTAAAYLEHETDASRVQPDGSGGASRRHTESFFPDIRQRMNAPLQRSTAAADGQL